MLSVSYTRMSLGVKQPTDNSSRGGRLATRTQWQWVTAGCCIRGFACYWNHRGWLGLACLSGSSRFFVSVLIMSFVLGAVTLPLGQTGGEALRAVV